MPDNPKPLTAEERPMPASACRHCGDFICSHTMSLLRDYEAKLADLERQLAEKEAKPADL